MGGELSLTDQAILEWIRDRCATLPEADESELQDRPLFHVRRRRFAIFNGEESPARPRWNGCGQSLHLLTDPAERDALSQDRRFNRSPHHGDQGWMAYRFDGASVDWNELAELLEAAFREAAPLPLCGVLDEAQARRRRRP